MQKFEHGLWILLFGFFLHADGFAQDSAPIHSLNGEYITEWLVLGPFFPDDLNTDFLANAGGETNLAPNEGDIVVTTQGDTLTWKRYRSNKSIINLLHAVGNYEQATAYAYCTVQSEFTGKNRVLFGSDDGAAIWIDGKRMHYNPVARPLYLDNDVFEADFNKGANHCLVKISQGIGDWGFAMRVVPHDRQVAVTPKFFLSSEHLQNEIALSFLQWKYHAGDNHEWAKLNFDDSSWELVVPELEENKSPIDGWNGVGWFRLHLAVDSSLWNRPLALNLRQLGAASEIYLDGTPLAQFGEVGNSKQNEAGYITANTNALPPPQVAVFTTTHHVLAIRHSNFHFTEIYPQQWQGFGIVLSDLPGAMALNASQRRANTTIQMIVTIIPIAFAILHLLLFLFYRRAKENLYYALFTMTLGFALFVACQVGFSLVTELEQTILFFKLTQALLTFALLAGLRFLYAIFYPKPPKQFWIFLLLGAGWVIWQWSYLFSLWQLGTALFLTMLLEMLRIAVFAIRRKREGAWIIGAGFILFTTGFIVGILAQIGILPHNLSLMNASYLSGLFGLLLSMSVFLARHIARTEVENARKTMELEAARKLQLSLLPTTVPSHPNFEIAIYMQTASEVGGDYYDFKLHEDGTLTTVIGDATGHGMQAGTMVSATKSLFHALAEESTPLQFLQKGAVAMKAMGLRKMYMALTVAKFKDHHMQVAAAGMPCPLIYRSATGRVEEVTLTGMPLGGFANFPYREKEYHLQEGDIVLFMSDGFEEMFNPRDETLGDARAKAYFEKVGTCSPHEIIAHLKKSGEAWANGRAQQDDVTFVVVRIK